MISFLSISNSEDYADVSELDGTIGFHEVISCHDVVAIQPGPRRYESAWPGPQHPPPSPSSSPLLDNPEQRLGASNASENRVEASMALAARPTRTLCVGRDASDHHQAVLVGRSYEDWFGREKNRQ